MIRVQLTPAEVTDATKAGKDRLTYNQGRVKDHRVATDKDSLEIHVNGCKAELAVVKVTGYTWNKFERNWWKVPKDRRKADVGPIEVRTTNWSHNRRLIFQRDGRLSRPHLLVLPAPDHAYELIGWMFGFECAKDCYWMRSWKRPCFAIQPEDLFGIRSLHAWCRAIGGPEWHIPPQDHVPAAVFDEIRQRR